MRRDQILREKEAAKSSSAPIPARPEVPRHFTPDRSHNLPSRPEAPLPGRNQVERNPPLRHGERRDGRDLRLPESGRLDRPGDRPREFQSDRRGVETNSRDFRRPSDRDQDRGRPEPPPRWTAESARENQERAGNGPRESDQSGRLSRDGGMLPPRTSATSIDRGYPVSSDKMPPVTAERQEFVNPERAAFISSTTTPPRSDSPRRIRDDLRDRSRPTSPRRYPPERDYQDSRHDERSSRNGPIDPYSSRSRPEDIQPPAGPRSDRPADRTGERGPSDRPRDASAFQPAQPPPRPIDPNHGRLNSNSRQQPDPNFGRLNPTPASDIPSGPRDRNPRGNRMVSAPQPRRDGRLAELPRPPTPPEMSVPTGPSSTRQPRRSASGQIDQPTSAPTAPSTPSAASPAGIHPDRLKHLGHNVPLPEPPQPPPSEASASGIHPDRLKAFTGDGSAPPGPQPNNRSRPQVPSVVTQGPPSRPRVSQPSPISTTGSGLTAPTGPASATERSMRGGRRQLAGINTMLQQAGQQNAPERLNVRGRGARLAGETPPFAGPPTPTGPTPAGPPSGRQEPTHDIMNPARADLITGIAPSDPHERGGRRDRSSRHTRRESHSPIGDRSRDAKRGPADDERDAGYRDHRDRKDGGRNEDRHPGRESSRDIMPGGRDGERERDRDREPSIRRGEARERDSHDGPWAGGDRGGRSRDMRDPRSGDDRRDSRDNRGPREDSSGGRKRKSDEGMADRGHEKRIRR
jgi:THO complex subunit 2